MCVFACLFDKLNDLICLFVCFCIFLKRASGGI